MLIQNSHPYSLKAVIISIVFLKMISKSQTPPIRVFGQRSIDSTFPKLPSASSINSNDLKGSEQKQTSHKNTPLSLSDFLDRKLHKSSTVIPRIQGKPTPFSSPVGLGVKNVGIVEQVDGETKIVGERVIFEKFKHNDEGKGDFFGPNGVIETENSLHDDMQGSRKRKNLFAGLGENQTVKRKVITLGGDSTRTRRQIGRPATSSSSSKSPYNHYKNGRGWWDCDMEGIDNEEVGFHEVWEGVGSTSLGEIADWH